MGEIKPISLWERMFPKGISWWEILLGLAAATGSIIGLLTYISNQSPHIIIDNHLTLKVDITINGEYRGRVAPDNSRKFTLYTDDPVEVVWEVVRQNNTDGKPVGDVMKGSYQSVGNGKNIPITNVNSKKEFFFTPIISNTTNQSCKIYINYGKPFQKYAGILNPQVKNVNAGYYKWVEASNVTLICKDGKLYWWGDIKGKRRAKLIVQPGGSGISNLTLVTKETP